MLSLVRAFASFFSVRLTIFGLNCEANSWSTLSISRCEYHTSRLLHPRELRHRGAVPADRVEHDPVLLLGAKAVVARRDQHAHGQALDVPLPRPGERLIEIVDVEHQPPLGRGEHPEVRQVRIPAALHGQPRPRRRREIMRHDHRRPAIERERRDQHPPVADRHQLRHTRLRLTLEQLDRIGASRRAARTTRDSRAAPLCAPPYHARPARPPTDAAPASALAGRRSLMRRRGAAGPGCGRCHEPSKGWDGACATGAPTTPLRRRVRRRGRWVRSTLR